MDVVQRIIELLEKKKVSAKKAVLRYINFLKQEEMEGKEK